MIWFACKQCGKHHGRGEDQAGAMVFCDCGQGNRVPWSSTVAEPEPEEALPAPPPRIPRPQLNEDWPPPFSPPTGGGERGGTPRRLRSRRRPDPAYCLNHEDTPKQVVCNACRCSFCAACVVELQGQTLCGPCKNFRVSSLRRPLRVSPLAIVSFVLALVCVFVSLVLCIMAIGFTMRLESGLTVSLPCCAVALFFAIGELVVSGMALRQMDRQPALGGRGFAMTGAMAGLTGVVWALALALFIVARQVQS